MRFILITILLISTHISFASLTCSTDTTLTESSQHMQLKQEVRNIQHQLDLISQNIEELNKSGGRIINASTYKELSFNIINQLNTNEKKEELIIELINRYPDNVRQMLSINTPGSEGFYIMYSFFNEFGGNFSITLPLTFDTINQLVQNIDKSTNPDLYAVYLFKRLTTFIESASTSFRRSQQDIEVSNDQFLKLKNLGDYLISKFSEDDNANLMLRFHYYTLLMGHYHPGGLRNLYFKDLRTDAGLKDEMLSIYSELLSVKSLPNKDRILDQINSGIEFFEVNGYGVPTKANLHISIINLIDHVYFTDPAYQKSLGYMTYTYQQMVNSMYDNYQGQGGMDYIMKFCLKI